MCINSSIFNSELTLLKPSRNRDQLPYSHRGGTNHGELKTPARDGVRVFSLRTWSAKPLAHSPKLSACCPACPRSNPLRIPATAARGALFFQNKGLAGSKDKDKDKDCYSLHRGISTHDPLLYLPRSPAM